MECSPNIIVKSIFPENELKEKGLLCPQGMSCIFYYSNYCPNCRSYIQTLSHSSVKDDIHFICLDKRTKKPNGSTYVILDNGQEILLPPTISKVPALLLLNEGHRVIFGEEIQSHFQPRRDVGQQEHLQPMGEPDAFPIALGRSGGYGVASDSFSFLMVECANIIIMPVSNFRNRSIHPMIHMNRIK